MKNGKSNARSKETDRYKKEWWVEREKSTQLSKEKFLWNKKLKEGMNMKRTTWADSQKSS